MSKGRHRKRHLRRAVITTAVSALAVIGTGAGFAAAQSPPVTVRIAGDPVIAPEPATAPATQAAPSLRVYIAREGDTLWSVAVSQCRDGNDWRSLASANRISSPYPVTPGQRLAVSC